MHKSEFLILSYVQCRHSLQEVWSFLNADFKFAAKPCTFSIRRSSAHTTINYQVPTAILPHEKIGLGGWLWQMLLFFPYPSTASLWYKFKIFTQYSWHIYPCISTFHVCVFCTFVGVCGCVWLADIQILH